MSYAVLRDGMCWSAPGQCSGSVRLAGDIGYIEWDI
jgi:hypothetical protein